MMCDCLTFVKRTLQTHTVSEKGRKTLQDKHAIPFIFRIREISYAQRECTKILCILDRNVPGLVSP